MDSLQGLSIVAFLAVLLTLFRRWATAEAPHEGVRVVTPLPQIDPVFSLERQAEEAGDAAIGAWRRWPELQREGKLAVIARGDLGRADRVAPWLRLALTDGDPGVRSTALAKAAASGWDVFLPLLLHGLGSEHMQVKLAAIEGLTRYRSPLVKQVWLRLLGHPVQRFRETAARGLASFGSRDVITPLLGRYRQADAEERRVLAEVLAELRDARVKGVELRRTA